MSFFHTDVYKELETNNLKIEDWRNFMKLLNFCKRNASNPIYCLKYSDLKICEILIGKLYSTLKKLFQPKV